MRPVVVADNAYRDLQRLEDWLLERDLGAARRFGDVVADAIASLRDMPERGRARGSRGVRELVTPFGSAAYLIQYRVYPDRVVVVRITHSRERR